MTRSPLFLTLSPRFCALGLWLGLLPGTAFCGSLIALDFDDRPAPALESFGAGTTLKTSLEAEGTIDAYRGSPSMAAILRVESMGLGASWKAGLRTPLLPFQNTAADLSLLTLSFDLAPGTTRPVRVRVQSFDSARKPTGVLEKWVYPPAAGSFYRHSMEFSQMSVAEGKFDPVAPLIQISWEIGNSGAQPWPNAKDHVMRIDNVNVSAPSFYVTPGGSDKADGRTEATAFASIERGVAAAKAGDTVLVFPGTYVTKGINLSASGTPARWITLKGAPGTKPRVEFAGWAAFTFKNGAAYTELSGLEIVGNARNVSLEEAVENGHAEKPDSRFNGTAVAVEGRTIENGATVKDELPFKDRADRPHHLRLIGCDIHDACGAGFAALLGDYLTIEGNTVSDCAVRSRYAHSGITLYWAWNFDASTGHRNFIRNNVAARNRTMVAWLPRWESDPSKAHLSDGNGIIIDDFIMHQPGSPQEPNLGRTLVQNNLSHSSGGGGIHIFASDRVDVVNNTAFANCQTPIIDYGQIDTSWSHDCRVLNNIAVAGPGKTLTRNRSRQNKPEPSNRWEHNVFFGDDKTTVAEFGESDAWADPLFVRPAPDSPATGFAFQTESPARARGLDSDIVCGLDIFGTVRPLGNTSDCGAIQSAGAAGKTQ